MAFDPISHAAGIGAGQEEGRRAAAHAEMMAAAARQNAALARIEADGAHQAAAVANQTTMIAAVALKLERDKNAALQAEIQNKWIPYGVRLRASIMATRVQKDDLIAALKASNPEHADRIAREAEARGPVEYDRLTKPGSKELAEVNEIVKTEAEAGRLDK